MSPMGALRGHGVDVTAITKCLIGCRFVKSLTAAMKAFDYVWPHCERVVRSDYGEKIMSKTATHNAEVREVTAVREPSRELSADELARVTGGHVFRITNVRANATTINGGPPLG